MSALETALELVGLGSEIVFAIFPSLRRFDIVNLFFGRASCPSIPLRTHFWRGKFKVYESEQ